MARIKKLKENGKTVYPATIWNAVVDPATGMTLKQLVAELTDALNRIDASTLQGHGIVTAGELDPKNKIPVVGNDGVMEIGRYLDFHMDGRRKTTTYACGATRRGSTSFTYRQRRVRWP